MCPSLFQFSLLSIATAPPCPMRTVSETSRHFKLITRRLNCFISESEISSENDSLTCAAFDQADCRKGAKWAKGIRGVPGKGQKSYELHFAPLHFALCTLPIELWNNSETKPSSFTQLSILVLRHPGCRRDEISNLFSSIAADASLGHLSSRR